MIRIGSRASKLALAQAATIADLLGGAEIIPISTSGDNDLSVGIGKGLFSKEIHQALLEDRIDIAVHSLKDLETTLPEGIVLAAVSKCESPVDVLICHNKEYESIAKLPQGSLIGTCSPRRSIQLSLQRPDIKIIPIRGNILTRLEKLKDLDGIILARAGLKRLGINLGTDLSIFEMLPAMGQGVLGITCKAEQYNWLQTINDQYTWRLVQAERSLVHHLNGNCHTPIAAFAQYDGPSIILNGMYHEHFASHQGESPEKIGRELACILQQKSLDSAIEG